MGGSGFNTGMGSNFGGGGGTFGQQSGFQQSGFNQQQPQ